METNKLFIPIKCKVGFNERKDTYTGFLGYVICFDGKVWRKEKSWEGWKTNYFSTEEQEKERLEQFDNLVKSEKRYHQLAQIELIKNPKDIYYQKYILPEE